MARNIASHERQGSTAKITLSSKAIFLNKKDDRAPQKRKTGVHHHQVIIIFIVHSLDPYLRERGSKL